MSDAAQNPTTPGWYPDPDAPAEHLRYFDGIIWTAHRTPLAPPKRPEPQPEPQPEPEAPVQPAAREAASPSQRYQQTPPQQAPTQQAPTQQAPTQQQGANAFGHRPSAYDQVGSQAPRSADGYLLASFGQRAAAWLLDGLIKIVINLLLGGWAAYLAVKPSLDQLMADLEAGRGASIPIFDVQADVRWMTVYAVIQGFVGLAYSVWFLTRPAQATPGKRAMSLHVRRVDGERITVQTAAIRYVIPFLNAVCGSVAYLSSLLFGLWTVDQLSAAWDPKRQALHDKMAGTQVVVTPPR